VIDIKSGPAEPGREKNPPKIWKPCWREPGTIRERMARALEGEEVTFNWYSPRPGSPLAHLECTLSRIEIEVRCVSWRSRSISPSGASPNAPWPSCPAAYSSYRDEERRRIARDLHDATGQHLGPLASSFRPSLASPDLEPRTRASPGAERSLDRNHHARDGALFLTCCTRPLLDELGLDRRSELCRSYSQRTGIRVDLSFPSHMGRLPQAIEIALFRIVQEGTLQCHRHSESADGAIPPSDSVELECGPSADWPTGTRTTAYPLHRGSASALQECVNALAKLGAAHHPSDQRHDVARRPAYNRNNLILPFEVPRSTAGHPSRSSPATGAWAGSRHAAYVEITRDRELEVCASTSRRPTKAASP